MLDSQTRSDLGVTHHQGIARLRVFSTHATAMTLCLVDADGTVTRTIEMASMPGGIWQAECAELVNGQRYAVRADGPSSGTNAFDKHRLLVEPYARQVANVGTVAVPIWTAQVVETEPFDWGQVRAPLLPLRDVVVYEAHVKGFTQLAPHMPEELRGSYAGLAHEDTIAYLQSVGVTAVELLPVHAFASESFLRRQGMANYWGYNTLGFFAPHADYASPPPAPLVHTPSHASSRAWSSTCTRRASRSTWTSSTTTRPRAAAVTRPPCSVGSTTPPTTATTCTATRSTRPDAATRSTRQRRSCASSSSTR